MKRLIFTLTFLFIVSGILAQNSAISFVHKQQIQFKKGDAPGLIAALTTHQPERVGEVTILTEKRIDPSAAYTAVYNDIHLITDYRKYRITDNGQYEYYEGSPVAKKNEETEHKEYVYGYKAISEREFFYATRNEGILPANMDYRSFAWMSHEDKKIAILNEMNLCLEMPPVMVSSDVKEQDNEEKNELAVEGDVNEAISVSMLSCKLIAGN